MFAVSIHRLVASLAFLALLVGCKASASINDKGAKASYDADDGSKQWDGDNETGEGADGPGKKKGRSVEGHAFESGGDPRATFPGFRVFKDGSSRVFVEVSGHVPVAETNSQGLLTFRFDGVKVPERVNQLDLPTQFFDTPVTLVQMRQGDAGAELRIHVRRDVKPKVHLKRTENGTVLSVDFPKYDPQHHDDEQVIEHDSSSDHSKE
jgi:hypothetical protein